MKRAVLAALATALTPLSFAEAAQTDTLPFEAFAQDLAILDADVSPDGRWLSVVQRATVDGEPFLGIYDARDLSKGRLRTLGGRGLSVGSARWANDDYLIVNFRQQIDDGENTRRVGKVASVHRSRGSFNELPAKRADKRRQGKALADDLNKYSGSIVSMLPGDPEHVMVSYVSDVTRTARGVSPISEIAKVEVDSGRIVSSVSTNTRYGGYGVDADGEIRSASTRDPATGQIIFLAREKGDDEWKEVGRTGAGTDSVISFFSLIGIPDMSRPNEALVISNHESDTAAVYLYDLEKNDFVEMLFKHPKYDAVGVETVPDPEDPRNYFVTGFRYDGRGGEVYWIDEAEKAFSASVEQAFPNTNVSVRSASEDRKTQVLSVNGPQVPTTYYLYNEDQGVQLIGESMPQLSEDDLSPTEFVTYKARDGYEIPAYVTKPKGEGPFPAVVMPHGGPVARDTWGFDPWMQLLAHHGYAVIQPQYRVSTGFGKAHTVAGFNEWGQLQQDDIDDAGQYLVDEGIADPDRLAIFGWSYGGYSSFVGAARDPNPYKCAIPGAGVSDLADIRAQLYAGSNDPLTKYRDTVTGVNPLDLASSVDVPVLIIHGTEDERVPISHSDKFAAAMRREGKEHEYLKLEGANHFFGTINYEHYMQMYPKMIDWLDNTCGLKNEG